MSSDGDEKKNSLVEQPDADVLTERQLKLLKECDALEKSLAISDFSTLRARVAWVLNVYPTTRDSDITLQLKYWEKFESDILTDFDPEKLYKGTRLTALARVRAKIQNEYGLFQAREHIKRTRRQFEEWTQEAVLAEQPDLPRISVHADESGKSKRWNIIGGVWGADGHETFRLTGETMKWLDNYGFTRFEFHFSKVSQKHLDLYRDWWDWVLAEFPSYGFKALILDSHRQHDSTQSTFHRLYPRYIVHGIRHEWDTGRVDSTRPCTISITIDEEDRNKDAILRDKIRDELGDEIQRQELDEVVYVDRLTSQSSAEIVPLQLADLFVATINRFINESANGSSPKDQLATHIQSTLGIHINEDGSLSTSGDRVVIEYLE